MITNWRRPVLVLLCVLAGVAGRVDAQGPWSQADPGFPSPTVDMMEPGTLATAQLPALKEVTFNQRLNNQLPMDAGFKDESGKAVTLGDYFGHDRPVILAFVYYSCPMLCNQVLNGVARSVKMLTTFQAGRDFDVVFISFDPRDTPEAASAKKTTLLNYWSTQSQTGSWHFLTGEADAIARTTSAAGFSYKWDEQTKQFAHLSGVLLLTPDGRLSRYFYGVEYSPKELRMALVESGQGKIGSVVDQLLLYCYHYDPANGRYGAIVMNIVRLGGAMTAVALAGFIALMRWRETHPPMEGHA